MSVSPISVLLINSLIFLLDSIYKRSYTYIFPCVAYFFYLGKQSSIVYMGSVFFIQRSVDRHLGCFHVLVIVNGAVATIGVQVSFPIRVFSRYMPRSCHSLVCAPWGFGALFILGKIVLN